MHIYDIEGDVFGSWAFGVPKHTDRVITPTGSILLPPNPYRGFADSFNYFLSNPILLKADKNKILA
jgi:hypothetical protein